MSNLNIPRSAHSEFSAGAATAASSGRYPLALPAGESLGDYEIVRVLGQGGFGIVYLAYDRSLARLVAVKEYFPATLASRGPDRRTVAVRSPEVENRFHAGLRAFIGEARLLARFDHPSLVSIYRFWEANGTAYMVMPYYEGRTLLETRRALGKPASEAWLRNTLVSLLGGLELLHGANCIHRDISPENILVLPDGRAVLLDYAVLPALDESGEHTTILKPTWAPIEQFAESAEHPQGPWTDLYSLAAVGYFCVAGRPPPPSTSRALERDERLGPLGRVLPTILAVHPGSSFSEPLVKAIDWALAVRPSDRPQTVAEWRVALAKPKGGAVGGEPMTTRPGGEEATVPFAEPTAAPVQPRPPEMPSPAEAPRAAEAPPATDDAGPRGAEPVFASSALPPRGSRSINESIGLEDLPAAGERRTQVDAAILNAIDAALSGFDNLDSVAAASPAPSMTVSTSDVLHTQPGAEGASATRAKQYARRRRRNLLPAVLGGAALLAALGVVAWIAFPGSPALQSQPGDTASAVPANPVLQGATSLGRPSEARPPSGAAPQARSPAAQGSEEASSLESSARRGAAADEGVPMGSTTVLSAASGAAVDEPPAAGPVDGKISQPAQPKESTAIVPGSAEPNNPRAVCGPRANFSLLRCMEMQCQRSKFTQHAQCVKLRETGEVD